MSEEQGTIAPEVVAEAKGLGWVPKEEYKGDESRWVDADAFVKRGQEIMPILRQNNRRLQEAQERLARENAALKEDAASLKNSVEALKKFHTENLQERLESQRKKLLLDLKTAKKDEDVDAEVDITDALTEVTAELKEAKKKAEEKPAPTKTKDPAQDPAEVAAFLEWQGKVENQWYGSDMRRTQMAAVIAAELRQKGEKAQGVAFYDLVSAEVGEIFDAKTKPTNKVEGSRGGSGGGSGGGGSGSHTYANLPADAKAACDRQGKQYDLIGKGKAFETEAAWRANYVSLYDWE